MHLRNKYYNNAPDFIKLAESYPSLKKYIKFQRHSKQGTLNFKDPRAVRELTYALLWCDFQIRLEIPLDTLCPVIPGRLDYIHWIEDLIHSSISLNPNQLNAVNNSNNNDREAPQNKDISVLSDTPNRINDTIAINENYQSPSPSVSPSTTDIIGIDIGTGASCIYPLLACKLHSDWKFEALELNERSYEYAKDNVERNGMKGQIKVRRVKHERDNVFSQLVKKKKKRKGKSDESGMENLFNDILQNPDTIKREDGEKNKKRNNSSIVEMVLKKLGLQLPDYTFCMCNPPFYSSESEMEESRAIKVEDPHSVCTGSSHEMLTEGGEVQFISRLIDDSVQLYRERKKAMKKLCKCLNVVGSGGIVQDSNLLNERILKRRMKKAESQGLVVQWYTSLIGKKSSVEPLVSYLRTKKEVKEVRTTNFKQGKTVRWGIAWTFKAIKPCKSKKKKDQRST